MLAPLSGSSAGPRALEAQLAALPVQDFMAQPAPTVLPNDTLDTVLELLTAERYPCIVVTEADRTPIGTISAKDLSWYLSWVRSGAIGNASDTRTVRARTLMQRARLIAHSNDSVHEILQQTRSSEIDHVPVVDVYGRITGVISQTDMLQACSTAAAAYAAASPVEEAPALEHPLDHPVRSILRKSVVHLAPEDLIGDAIELMARGRISCVLVTEEMRPIGILTERDITLLSWTSDSGSIRTRPLREVMRQPLTCIMDTATIRDAMRLLERATVRHLPVLNERNLLTGVLTQTDIVSVCRRILDP